MYVDVSFNVRICYVIICKKNPMQICLNFVQKGPETRLQRYPFCLICLLMGVIVLIPHNNNNPITTKNMLKKLCLQTLRKTRLTYNCAHLRSTKESLTIWVKFFGVKFFLGEGGEGSEGSEGGDWVRGVMGVVRLTRGRYPPSDLECLSRQDSENIAHC